MVPNEHLDLASFSTHGLELSAAAQAHCTQVPATTRRWDRRPKRREALGKPDALRRSLPGAGRAGCAWTEQSGLAEGEKWRLKRPLRAAVQDAKRTHAGGVYFSLAPTLGYYELNVNTESERESPIWHTVCDNCAICVA